MAARTTAPDAATVQKVRAVLPVLAAGSLVADPLWAGLSDRIGRKPLLLVRPVSSLFCRLIQLYGMAHPVRPPKPSKR